MNRCPICEEKDELSSFFKKIIPLYNLEIHTSRDSALKAKTGVVDSCFCHNCHFVFNKSFNSDLIDYTVNYEAS
jgi:hypothetical protein